MVLQIGHRRSLFSPLMATQAPYFLNSFMFRVASCPLSCSRVDAAQKMLCRRFFPRPGERTGTANNGGIGKGLKGRLSFTRSDPVSKGMHLDSSLCCL